MDTHHRLNELFDRLWKGYSALNPQALKIHGLLAGRGEDLINDHIAFRTLNFPGMTVDDLAKPFVQAGYREGGRYVFVDKHLTAKHWQHPDEDRPKVFISQLETRHLSPGAQSLLQGLANQVPSSLFASDALCHAGRPWGLRKSEYQALARESEYAGWMAAFGFLANHFTVAAHRLRTFSSLSDLLLFLKGQGFSMNQAGGEIKGSSAQGLEQASTWAAEAEAVFLDGAMKVPGCYYEFAWRFPLNGGDLFHGFLEKSADKIFESTHSRKSG